MCCLSRSIGYVVQHPNVSSAIEQAVSAVVAVEAIVRVAATVADTPDGHKRSLDLEVRSPSLTRPSAYSDTLRSSG